MRQFRPPTASPAPFIRMLTVLGVCLTGHVSAVDSFLKASVRASGPLNARITVTTNLPDGAWLRASLRSSEARPNDPALGTIGTQAQVKDGRATLLLDQRNASTSVPRGTYQVTVAYSSFLVENAGPAKMGFTKDQSVTIPLALQGDGRSYQEVIVAIRRLNRFNQTFGVDQMKSWTLNGAIRTFGQGQSMKVNGSYGNGAGAFYFPAVDAVFVFDKTGRFLSMWSGPRSR